MIEVQPFARLGRFDNDWLAARYHFSFAGYHDPARRGLGPLLVWNDDTVAPRGGFDPHGHRDMEIVTYVRAGAITHRDHLGNEGRTEAGDVQVMSAGTGIRHSEYNWEAGADPALPDLDPAKPPGRGAPLGKRALSQGRAGRPAGRARLGPRRGRRAADPSGRDPVRRHPARRPKRHS